MSSSQKLMVRLPEFFPKQARGLSGNTVFNKLLSCFISTDLLQREKIVVDTKVYIFGMGMAQAFFKPRELPVLKQ